MKGYNGGVRALSVVDFQSHLRFTWKQAHVCAILSSIKSHIRTIPQYVFFSTSKYTKANIIVSSKWRQTSPSKRSLSHDEERAVLFVKRHRSLGTLLIGLLSPVSVRRMWLVLLLVGHRYRGVFRRRVVRIFRHLPDCSSTYFNSVAVRGENAASP